MRRTTLIAVLAAVIAGIVCTQAQAQPATIEEAKPLEGALRNILPTDIYAVPGVETNVYFETIVLHPHTELLLWDVDCDMGMQQNERWTCTPTEEEVGDHPLTIKVVSPEMEVLHEARATVHVIDPAAGGGAPRTMLCVGASQTAASMYTERMIELFAADESVEMRFIGESGPGGESGNRHEGYGGWTWEAFANRWDADAEWKEVDGRNRRVRSPFVFEVDGEPQLDFQQYLDKNNGGKAPDIITILLGCNDTFSSKEDTIEERIDAMFANVDKLLAELRRVAPETQIGVMYLVPASRDQDAFGQSYKCNQTRWQYRRNMHRVIEREMETYLGREAENISMVAAFVNVDPVWGFPGPMVPPNPHSEDTVRRMSNGAHPNKSGYYQMGDAVYCWVKSRLATDG